MQHNDKAAINTKQCKHIGEIIHNLKFRPSFYQREFLTFNSDKETKLRAYFYSVAICHQTYTLINKRKNLKGWDYLEYIFLNLAKNNPNQLDPGHLSNLSTDELSNKLKHIFSEDGNPDNCTLDRLEERSRFLIELGKIIKENYDNKISNIIESSDNLLVNKGHGLYEILEQLESFSDPARKKSTFFIKLLLDSGLMTNIKDPEHFVPVIDYHMQRVLLRMGCVEITDLELKRKLWNREKLDSDTVIRNACIQAINLISKISGYEILKMNDFFWPLRSCCEEKTLCFDKVCNKDPCTFNLVIDIPSHNKCVFEKVCKGSTDEEYRKYWQPIVNTHFY